MGHPPLPQFDRAPSVTAGQLALEDLGTPLHEVTFVVVDLETTGSNDITEIGAVKTLGGSSLEEFTSLVRPVKSSITPFVERLTGITNGMVAGAPHLSEVLPRFLEFSRGGVLVAHNAGFDIGFLKRACADLGYPWPEPQVLDTVVLARQVVPRPEVRNHKLGTLAAHFGTASDPSHRALDDARATSELLHIFLERFGGFGILTLEELASVRPAGWERRRSRAHLADDVPDAPGVYMFLDGSGRTLYIGVSARMRTRVRQYFSASETRGRMTEMVTAAQSVRALECETHLEAQVREVRLIAEHAPPYNRRSKNPERRCWLRLTEDRFPRLSVTRIPPDSRSATAGRIGPFRSQRTASAVKHLLEQLYPIRVCTQRVTMANPQQCGSGQLGRCGGPCGGVVDADVYWQQIAGIAQLAAHSPRDLISRSRDRMAALTFDERFEEAAAVRDALLSVLAAHARRERRRSLGMIEEVIVAMPGPDSAWTAAVIRYGRLAASALVRTGVDLWSSADMLRRTAEHVRGPQGEDSSALAEETEILWQWMSEGDGLILSSTTPWEMAVGGGAEAAASFRGGGAAQAT